MKKFLSCLAISLALLLFTACGETSSTETTPTETTTTTSSFSSSSSTSTSSSTSSGSSFTNKYGSSDTLCVKSGCTNPIASSGDTNCCTVHSNRCLECNCYIDGDAMYCMSCLEDAVSSSNSSSDYDSDYDYDYDYSDSSSDYDYDMPVEGESFSDYVQRVDPDLYNEMEDILASLS